MLIGEDHGARTARVCTAGRQALTGNGARLFPVGAGARLGVIAWPAVERAAAQASTAAAVPSPGPRARSVWRCGGWRSPVLMLAERRAEWSLLFEHRGH